MTRSTYLVAAIILTILAALYYFSLLPTEVRDDQTGMTGQQLWEEQHLPAIDDSRQNIQ